MKSFLNLEDVFFFFFLIDHGLDPTLQLTKRRMLGISFNCPESAKQMGGQAPACGERMLSRASCTGPGGFLAEGISNRELYFSLFYFFKGHHRHLSARKARKKGERKKEEMGF